MRFLEMTIDGITRAQKEYTAIAIFELIIRLLLMAQEV